MVPRAVVPRAIQNRFVANYPPHDLRAERRSMCDGRAPRIFRKSSLRRTNAMMEAPVPDRDPDERHDHLAVFREFLDHLERAARRVAPTPAKDRRPRTDVR